MGGGVGVHRLEVMCAGRRPAHATNLPKLAAKNVKNRPSAEFDTEIGASGSRHFLSFAERADYRKRGRCNGQSWTELLLVKSLLQLIYR